MRGVSRRTVDFMNYNNYRQLFMSHNTLAKLVEIPKSLLLPVRLVPMDQTRGLDKN